MKKSLYFILILICFSSTSAFSQQRIIIHGKVNNSTSLETVPAVSVTIKGGTGGTFTDDKGSFKLITTHPLPVTLLFSSIGYETQEITVTDAATVVLVSFKPAAVLGTEVVISASRLPERILESPVSIERVGIAAIRNSPAEDYYEIAKTLKGVDFTTSSLTFMSLSTRGFNESGNPRFNQFIDGMDNQAPGLNFSVGSIVGPSQLDVESMELLQGASSALYGSGGMNGTLLINSKDPFKYQGISVELKEGMMHLGKNDPLGASPYYNMAFRWGYKVSDKFAFKVGAEYTQAQDWVASDSSDYTGVGNQGHPIAGTRASDANYNGVNIYGDETSLNLNSASTPFLLGAAAAIVGADPAANSAIQGVLATDTLNPLNVSRTGYKETAIINPTTEILKLTGGLYYKLAPQTELSLTGNYGTGNTVYTGADRYSLKDLKMGQYKLEVKSDYWFLKAYTTQENSGNSYNATVAAQLFNEAWKPSYNPSSPQTSWYPQYSAAYLEGRSGIATGTPMTVAQANVFARSQADIGMPVPGSVQFDTLFNKVISKPIPIGAKFLDRTNLYHIEGQYNFTHYIKWAEVLAGASYRIYRLNSQGTIFADTAGPINTGEFGAYIQVSKKILEDKLKLTVSGRYDKNQNFQGKFTPRISAVYKVAPDQFIRASYQNAYHFPTNQNQWINLNTGAGILIGGLPQLRQFYHFDTNPAINPNTGTPQTFGTFKPESVNSYEIGYKGVFNKRLLVDVYIYYSSFQNFLGRTNVIQSKSGNPATINPADPSTYTGYSVSINSPDKVNTYGMGVSASYLLHHNFELDANFSNDNIDSPDSSFVTYWNTPKYRFNLGVANTGFGPKDLFGFNLQYRWQDKYYTESDFKQGNTAAFGTLDALISYKLPDIHSLIKIGATNLLDHYYFSAYANPAIGGLYYVSFAYNVF
jgi:outer membrane receptor protein involved in Fe transport